MRPAQVFFALGLLTASVSFATPYLDKDVQSYLSSHTQSVQPMSVLITYKALVGVPKRPYHRKYHAEIERALIANVRKQEQTLLQGLTPQQISRRRSYWIVNGS